VRQTVIANLGRVDKLAGSGALASLLASGAKFSDQVLLINALAADASGACRLRPNVKVDKALIGNTGFRRYLKTISDEHFAIDPDKIDGIFVLRTNTDLNPLEAMLCYEQLWTVEQTFHTAKHLFSTRPIFHKLDETIPGHVFCNFLALRGKTISGGSTPVWSPPAPALRPAARTARSTAVKVAGSIPGGIRTVAMPIAVSIVGDRSAHAAGATWRLRA
jgi:hypothetical protein